MVARRHLKALTEHRLDLLHQTLGISFPCIHPDHDPSLGILPRDLCRTFLHPDIGQFTKRNGLSVRQRNMQLPQIVHSLPPCLFHTDHQIVSAFAFEDHTGRFSGKCRLDEFIDLLNMHAIARHARAVVANDHLRKARSAFQL